MADFSDKLLGGMSGAAEALGEKLGDVTKTYISLEKIIPEVSDAFGEQATQTKFLNKELGDASRVSGELRLEMSKYSVALGISSKAQLGLLNITKEYHKSLNNTALQTLKFTKASGASTKEIGVMSAKLQILSNASESTFTDMYERLLAVRESYGLTANHIEIISNQIVKFSTVLGLNSDQIAQSAENLAVFTSKLTATGMEVNEVSDLIEKMIDPNKIMDNINLFSQMGLTISDLTIGNPMDKITDALPKLKQIGEEITNQQNRWVANEMAKTKGITLEMAREFANIDLSQAALDRQKSLAQYRAEVTTMKESVGNLFSMFSGTIGLFVNSFTGFSQTILKQVGDKVFSLTKTLGDWAEFGGIFGQGLMSFLGFKIGKKIFSKLSEVLAKPVLNAARKFGSDAGETLSKTFLNHLSPSVKNYLKEVEKRDQKFQNDKNVANQKLSDNAKGSTEPALSLLNEKAQKQVRREMKERDFRASNPNEDKISRAQELYEQVSTEEFSYQERLNELRNKSYNNTLTALETLELEQTEELKKAFDNYKQESLQKLEEALGNLSGISLDVSKHFKTLYNQLSDYTEESFSMKREEALNSIKSVLKTNLVSKYADNLSLNELKEAFNYDESDTTPISKRFAGIFENQKSILEKRKLDLRTKIGDDDTSLKDYQEYRSLEGKIYEIEKIINELNGVIEPTVDEFNSLDDSLDQVTKAQENYTDKIKDAIKTVNSTAKRESKYSILGNVPNAIKSFWTKTPLIGKVAAISAATFKLINMTENGQKATEEARKHINNIMTKIGEKIMNIAEGPLNFTNKILGKIDNSVAKINDTPGYDLKKLTLAYATADSIKNGQMFASQKEMNELLNGIKTEMKNANVNITNIPFNYEKD